MYRFFEVFKTLKLPEDLAVYFENVEVTKVSKTSTNSLARVYIKMYIARAKTARSSS